MTVIIYLHVHTILKTIGGETLAITSLSYGCKIWTLK